MNRTLGVDLGQASDPTALAVAERTPVRADIRHLERVPLGTPYPRVVERIGAVMVAGEISHLVVDGTGVGRAVVDMLESAGLSPLVVFITAGAKVRREGNRVWAPKRLLLRPLITRLETGAMRIAEGLADAPALVRELNAFRRTLGVGGHIAFEGDGQHDDLIVAAALALFS